MTITHEDSTLLARAAAWFATAATDYGTAEAVPDYGSDPVALARARAFQRSYFDAGLVGPTVPAEYGGLGLGHDDAFALNELAAGANLPDRRLFVIGLGMCIPTIIKHCTEGQRRELIPRILSGTDIWCQLFSEPGAGSDLAGVTTRARRTEDDTWIVNGQKVWTSHARAADYGLLLARTETEAPKHRSLTMFRVDMRSPGVEIKPLRQITGEAEFNEVFLEDLVLEDSARIGEVGNGWQVALTTLTSERQSLSVSSKTVSAPDAPTLLAQAGSHGPVPEPLLTQLLEYYLDSVALDAFSSIVHERVRANENIGSMGSVAKLASSRLTKDGAELASDIAARSSNPKDRTEALDLLLRSRNVSIAGGTDNIQRNIIAERILGLPK